MPGACALLLAPAVAMMIAACGKEDGTKTATQVAVKVNKEEITVHQLNNAITVHNLNPEQQRRRPGRSWSG
jgi:hypothetical protein